MFSDIKSIFKHSSIYGFSTILQKGIGFFMIPVYTGFLSPSDYGILELMELTINIISMLIGLRLGSGIIRFYHDYETKDERIELFSTALFFVSFSTLLLVLFLQLFTHQFSDWILGSSDYFRYFQIIFTAMGLQIIATIPESILLAEKKSVTYSTITIFTLLSYLTFNILFLVVIRIGVVGILLSMLITKALNTSSLLILSRHQYAWRFSFSKLKQMVWFTLPLVPASLFMFAMHYSDRFFIQKFCNLNELGLYSLGYKFGMIISVIISEPFFRIWNTKRFELAKDPDSEKKMGLFFTYYSLVVITAALGISTFIREVILLMTPDAYTNAASVVAAIAIAYVLYGISNFFNLGMMLTYKTKNLAYIQIGVAVFNIVINYFLIQKWGVHGAVASTLVSFCLLAGISLAVSQHLYPIKLEFLRVGRLWLFYFAFYWASTFINAGIFVSLILKSVLFLGFPLALFLTGFFSKTELQKSKELLGIVIMNVRAKTMLKGK